MGAGRSLAFSFQIEELATKSAPGPSPEDRNKGGLRHRRQAVDETHSHEIKFLCRTSNKKPHGAGHLAYSKPDPALPKIGARLQLTRRALDLTRFQMARVLGTDVATWGTYEAGVVRTPADQALKLSAYGITLDWVYQGRMTDLHPNIRAKIRQLATE